MKQAGWRGSVFEPRNFHGALRALAAAFCLFSAPAIAQKTSGVCGMVKSAIERGHGFTGHPHWYERGSTLPENLTRAGGGVAFALKGEPVTKQQADDFGLSADDWADVERADQASLLASGPDRRLLAIETIGGTLHCTRYRFFEARGGGKPQPVEGPPSTLEEGCGGAGWVGTVGKTPVFATLEAPLGEDKLNLVLRVDGKWLPACRVHATYSSLAIVKEQFCAAGMDCSALASKAKGWIDGISADGMPKGLKRALIRYGAADEILSATSALATLGAKAVESYTDYDDSAPWFDILGLPDINLARIGHGHIGWRISDDFLVSLYLFDGKKVTPRAGFVVVQDRTGLKKVLVEGFPK